MTTESPCGCVRNICHCQEAADLWMKVENTRATAMRVGTTEAWREYETALKAYDAHFDDEQEAA